MNETTTLAKTGTSMSLGPFSAKTRLLEMVVRRALVLLVLCIGCASPRPAEGPHIPLTPPTELCADATLGPDSLCLPAQRLEPLLKTARIEVLQVKDPSSGIGGAKSLVVALPEEQLTIKVKWKQSKHGGNGMNNMPRKEIAAYALQKLFLTPDEYVVPPTVGRCLQTNPVNGAPAEKDVTFDGVACVYGVLAYWIEHVTDEGVLDRQRLVSDAPYRASVANMNLLTYLINHRDTRPANFVISKDPKSPRVFSIDNGLAFSGLRNPRQIFLHEWNYIVVPWLPRTQIERLRRVTRADLDKLSVVAQYRVRADSLEEVLPTKPFLPDEGVRRSGDVLQFGLTTSEIDDIEERLTDLLARVDKGKIPLF
ncbi:MAG: hypothetical protein ABJE95_28625 [Byssovorax sp.]